MSDQPRVYIRRVARSDEREFTRLMRDSQYLHEPWISPPTNAVLFRHYLQRISREDHEGDFFPQWEEPRRDKPAEEPAEEPEPAK